LTLLVGLQEGHPASKKPERWAAGVVICLERGADLHTAQLMPLTLTVSCFSNHIGFTFLVPAYPGSHGKRAVKWVYVCEYPQLRTKSDVRWRQRELNTLQQLNALFVKTKLEQQVGVKTLQRITVEPIRRVQQTATHTHTHNQLIQNTISAE